MSRLPATDTQPTATQPTATQPTAPIACSLDATGLQSQEQRWMVLVRDAGVDRASTADGVRLTFRAGDGVERELRQLVAVESECCPWARWEVRAVGDGELVMHAGTSGDGVAVLQSMFPHDTSPRLGRMSEP